MDQDVTAQVLDGSFRTRPLRPGGRQVVRMEVTIEPTADRCDSRTTYLRTRSDTTPAWLDLVQVGISVSCARRVAVDRSDDLHDPGLVRVAAAPE
jgi:hypothetical protein